MKRFTALFICLALIAGAFMLASCNEKKGSDTVDTTTAAATKAEVTTVAEVTTAEETTAAVAETEEDTTAAAEETDGEETTAASQIKEGDVVIASKEDFIAFNKSVVENEDSGWTGYESINVIFTADIDMAGYNWIPMDGNYLDNVTFDGQGHKIINFTSDYTDDPQGLDDSGNFGGYGIVKNAYYDLTFKDIKFDTPIVKAYQKHAGVLIGAVYNSAYISIQNVDMVDVRVEGWMSNETNENGYGITIRDSAYVGAIFAGSMIEFKDCDLSGAYICGFHNQACFIGYDGSASVDETCFENCTAYDVTFEFSYCQSATYDAGKSYKFISVFFNGARWTDNIDAVKENGNLYGNIKGIDWTTAKEYDIDSFRSWTEDSASYQQYVASGSFAGID